MILCSVFLVLLLGSAQLEPVCGVALDGRFGGRAHRTKCVFETRRRLMAGGVTMG